MFKKIKFFILFLFLFLLILLSLFAFFYFKEDIYHCNSSDDCIAVECGCGCSGCGPSYDEIINKNYEKIWYFKNGCKPNDFDDLSNMPLCPMVCCQPGEIKCENHKCVFKRDPVENSTDFNLEAD